MLDKKKSDDIIELARLAKIEAEKEPEKIEKKVKIRRKIERNSVVNDKNILRAEIIEEIDPTDSNISNPVPVSFPVSDSDIDQEKKSKKA